MSFCGINRDVADPWYTGDFEASYRDITAGCKAFLEQQKSR
jgi:protein-tyrosine phosphatase